MASVFLSYVHEDAGKARPVARALERAGHKVWWDRFIKGGSEYCQEIEAELNKADFVVVLWSESSIHSTWVRDEAEAGRDDGRLIPVRLDRADPPLGFRQFQAIDLSGWKGHGEVRLRPLLDALSRPSAEPISSSYGSGMSGFGPSKRALLMVAIVVVIIGAGLAAWKYLKPSSEIPLVAIHAAEPTGPAKGNARDLLVKLGGLHSAKSNKMRLIGGDQPASKADLIFQVGAAGHGEQQSANLALLDGRDRSLLWSKEFQAQGGNPANVQQGMAYTAAQVLECAVEASGTGKDRIDQDTFKLFLNGCALFAEKYRTDPQSLVHLFLQILEKAPSLQPAWRKLLLAESLFTRTERLLNRHTPGQLPEHIAAARRLNPRIPELFVAESVLLPLTAYAPRSVLLERAVRLEPDNSDLLLMRAELNLGVGRNAEVVDDVSRAVELNPLSPGIRSHMIASLAYAGRVESAFQELRHAEELWPDSAAIDDARFRLNNRYGDPKLGLQMLRAGKMRLQPMVSPMVESFLIARIEPTEFNVRRAMTEAEKRVSSDPRAIGDLIQTAGQFHREEELYRMLLSWPNGQELRVLGEVLFRPPLAKFRRDPRFMRVAARADLVRYWKSSGKWPDFCFEPDLPYDCKTEAAKLAA